MRLLGSVVVLALGIGAVPGPPARAAEERAQQIARSVLEKMGGEAAWNDTRYVRWRFFGRRLHYWDRQSGDVRIESPAGKDRAGNDQPPFVILMNVNTKQGRAWESDKEVVEPAALAKYIDRGHQIWINDSYWMFMPYKLLDPGVTLAYTGERALPDGRPADVLDMTFGAGVGYTPENRYEVYVARDTGLVEQWSFYEQASNTEPDFMLPWTGWTQFGGILLATVHGDEEIDWEIAVYDDLPRSVFTSPAPVE